jgi:hypothetical protein
MPSLKMISTTRRMSIRRTQTSTCYQLLVIRIPIAQRVISRSLDFSHKSK